MNIDLLRELRDGLEIDIANAISPIVEEFKKETGYSPSRIEIAMTNITSFSDFHPEFCIGSVKISLATGLE